ncbi:sensor histidine kinase [Membranihabitans maritimus]|uniref:sensor histidine kinase n=1 Tax=Membranihabitans maritimus TaxID=2904244 RepID=UPI001F3BEBEA|nr:ATP-binding protein [Membranihabitans maritimus]
MFKNITPRQIAIYTALIISLVESILLLVIVQFFNFDYRWINYLILFGGSLLFSYFIILLVVQKFIFRKIKLIYKNIRDFRVGKIKKGIEPEIDVDSNVFDHVELEVKEWTAQKQKEIEDLKMLENYRREYIGNVAHELKTPVFNIQGYIHTLLDGGLRDDNINELYLSKAGQNVERLITVIEDLDVISKLESGKMILEMQNFDIRTLASEVFDDLELKARNKNIKLNFKDGAAIPFNVTADRESIRTVLNNLISNSIKYGKEDGKTNVGFYDMDTYILVEVSDNGIGVEQKHLRHLFDRFYRVDKSRSRKEGGSGLGLSIVKHILEAHNEPINVRSTPGVGTTFGFTLRKSGTKSI